MLVWRIALGAKTPLGISELSNERLHGDSEIRWLQDLKRFPDDRFLQLATNTLSSAPINGRLFYERILKLVDARLPGRVVEIGSGIGNLALGLNDFLTATYDGLEIHPAAVAWCQRAITPRYPAFRFHRADVASRAYNPGGTVPASAYRFPFPDRAFDFIFLASVFTHMMPDAVERYVHELSRLLAPGGTCVESYFLLNDETRRGVEAGRSFMSFGIEHPSGVCLLHDSFVPEAAVALDEGFVRRIHAEAGLRIHDVRRGQWWNGERHDQDVLTAALDHPA